MEKKPKNHWNFRIMTNLHKYDEDHEERLFSIIEAHYEDGKLVTYGGKNLLKDHDSVEGLEWTNEKIKEAFTKPIIDGDNWPNEWKQ